MAFGWDDAIAGVVNIINKFIPDPNAKLQAQQQVEQHLYELQIAALKADSDIAQGQLDVNKTEASNPSTFVSGWRPFIGWVCGVAFAGQFVVAPMAVFIYVLTGHTAPALPTMDWETMMPVLLGMLGLGGFRTFERVQGVPTNGKGHG